MRIIYEAYDGKQFDNELDCEIYEFKLNHPHLKDIYFFTKEKEFFRIDINDIWNNKVYFDCEAVAIADLNQYNDFIALANYNGWCEFEDFIDSPGFWVREEDELGNPNWKKTI